MTITPKLRQALQLYLSSVVVYGGGILLLHLIPFYRQTLQEQAQHAILLLYLAYLIISPFWYAFGSFPSSPNPYQPNKPYLFLQGVSRLVRERKLLPEEKTAFLFLGVKLFFLPIMANFFFNNLNYLWENSSWSSSSFLSYPYLLGIIFFLDTGIFTIGYVVEGKMLNNIVKSVEPTIVGWAAALICYPPFNGIVGKYVPWGANDYALFADPTMTTIMRVIILILFGIYLWATFALGFKASNLTNRGIVSRFPYSVVRHPAYISKNLVWWLTLLPVISWKFAVGMAFWSFIYYARAITEERHLRQDLDYLKYCEKVKWRFVPGVY